MSRGISREDAISVITSGFLNLDIPYIPEFLDKNIKEVIKATAKDALVSLNLNFLFFPC